MTINKREFRKFYKKASSDQQALLDGLKILIERSELATVKVQENDMKFVFEHRDCVGTIRGDCISGYTRDKPAECMGYLIAINDRGIDQQVTYSTGLYMPIWTGATSMVRRAFDDMGGFPLGVRLGEDFLLWAKTAVHYRIAYINKPLAYYNNDVPASLRATRNLHAPQYHMLFNLKDIEGELRAKSQEQRVVWQDLLDKLRISGLMDYWLSDEYHNVAAAELAKVDWNKQSKSAKAQYEKPIWYLKAKRRFLQIGSYCKQKLIRIRYK